MVWVSPHAWSLEIVENLARFTNLRVILAQVLGQSSLYRSNFNISIPVANSMTKLYTWIDKSLSLAFTCGDTELPVICYQIPATRLQCEMPAAGLSSM